MWPRFSVSERPLLFPRVRDPTTSRFVYATLVSEGQSDEQRSQARCARLSKEKKENTIEYRLNEVTISIMSSDVIRVDKLSLVSYISTS